MLSPRTDRAASWLPGVTVFLLAACAVGDEGRPCLLFKAADGGSAPLLESEVPRGKDVVSYGVPECEEWMCIRDAHTVAKQAAPGAQAVGYCTRPCAPATGCASVDPANPLTCRQFLYGGAFLCAAPLATAVR